jgi:YjbE family integral membrane protein
MAFTDLIVTPSWWASLANIIVVNIVLSGDNAVVIALAAHALPARQQRSAIVFGSAAAIAMRTVLTIFAIALLTLPYLKAVGGILLFYIAVKLMSHRQTTAHQGGDTTIGAAVRTILLADLVMSLDNVLGVAAASHGNVPLLVVGLVLSVPLIVFGSTFVLKIMQKFPIVVVAGAALLAYLGGEMLASDPAMQGRHLVAGMSDQLALVGNDLKISISGTICAIAAILLGAWRAKRANSRKYAGGKG